MITEEFLYFIWEHGLHRQKGLKTTSGEPIKILHPGYRNMHAGPDFLQAFIRIGSLLWAGNVEIHTRSSHWKAHGHHLDSTYDSVILHVVQRFEGNVCNSKSNPVYTCCLSFPRQILERFEDLTGGEESVPCSHHLKKVPEGVRCRWIQQLSRERLVRKSDWNTKILSDHRLSREETLYRTMARGFGLPVNADPFERLASGIPVSLIERIRDNITELEGVLFGQSGLLESHAGESTYVRMLQAAHREYAIQCLSGPVPGHMWKFLRMRPASFPTLKVAQFASLLQQRFPLFQSLMGTSSLPELEQLLRVKASPYWDSHYQFEKISSPSLKYLGFQSIQTLIINVVVPFLHALGRAEKQQKYLRWASSLLMELEYESNHIIKKWITFGMKPRNASESQALIHLYNAFCREKKCVHCSIGGYLMETGNDEKI